jgi:ATP-binding cassette, subfamily B, bacterial
MTDIWLAMRQFFQLAMRIDRRRLVKAAVLLLLGYAATPLVALCLKGLIDAVLDGHAASATWFAVAAAVLVICELMLGHFAHLHYFELGELQEVERQCELVITAAGTESLSGVDNPQFADMLQLVREDVVKTRAALEAVLQATGLGLQTIATMVILAFVQPVLFLLPFLAVPPVLIGRRAQAMLDKAKEEAAEANRQTRDLLRLASAPASAMEIRLFGAGSELRARQRESWAAASSTLARANLSSAALRSIGQLLFALAYAGTVLLVTKAAMAGQVNIGDVILVITLAIQVSTQMATVLGLLATLQGAGRTIRRIGKLREAATEAGPPGLAAREAGPAEISGGIRLEHVTFRYPGSENAVLEDIDLEIPAGSTIALVGENGAGKSTLVKLLCGLYRPTEGRILVDTTDLAAIDPGHWRARVATLFQDFGRFEFLLRESIGLGDLSGSAGPGCDGEAVRAAVRAAGAEQVVTVVPGGLDGTVGKAYQDGAALSGGQWQKLGLARTLIRPEPLLLIMDEPASALDAQAEHALFGSFTDNARTRGSVAGAVTLLITHRFSTVMHADRILVLDRGRVCEWGSHEQLMAAGGLYSELFLLQAGTYSSEAP